MAVPSSLESRLQSSIQGMRSARAAEDEQIHKRQWAAFDARRAAVTRRAPRPAAPNVPLGTTSDRNENLRMAAAAEAKSRGVRDAGFLKWKAETTAKAKAYDAGETVRLGVNNQIVAKKSSAIDAQRIAQNQANALRRRAEMEAFYAKRGQRLVYGPAGSMAIAANAQAPAGFDGQMPGMVPPPIMAARPPMPQVPAKPTPAAPVSQVQPQPIVPGGGAMPMGGGGAAVVGGMAGLGAAGFKQIVAQAAQALGRMPTSYKEIMAVLGAKPGGKRSPNAGRNIYDNPNTYPLIGDISPWQNDAPLYSGSM